MGASEGVSVKRLKALAMARSLAVVMVPFTSTTTASRKAAAAIVGTTAASNAAASSQNA
jgi:hypothetical protein